MLAGLELLLEPVGHLFRPLRMKRTPELFESADQGLRTLLFTRPECACSHIFISSRG